MKKTLPLFVVLMAAVAVNAQEMKPLPDMSSSEVPTARDAESTVMKKIMADPNDGLSATESVSAKLSFTLGFDSDPFGKKGDRVWQVHRVSFAQTSSILWVNAETGAVRLLYPQKHVKRQSYADRLRERREEMRKESVEQDESTVPVEAAPSAPST